MVLMHFPYLNMYICGKSAVKYIFCAHMWANSEQAAVPNRDQNKHVIASLFFRPSTMPKSKASKNGAEEMHRLQEELRRKDAKIGALWGPSP